MFPLLTPFVVAFALTFGAAVATDTVTVSQEKPFVTVDQSKLVHDYSTLNQ